MPMLDVVGNLVDAHEPLVIHGLGVVLAIGGGLAVGVLFLYKLL